MVTVVTSTTSPRGSPPSVPAQEVAEGQHSRAFPSLLHRSAILAEVLLGLSGHTRTDLPSSLFSHVPAVMKPGRPSRAPIKDVSTPITTLVPMTQVRADLGTAAPTQIPFDSQGPHLPQQLCLVVLFASTCIWQFQGCGNGLVLTYLIEDFPELRGA